MKASEIIERYEAYCPRELSMEGDISGLQIGTLDKEVNLSLIHIFAETAGAEVVSSYRQKREKYDSKSLIGSGKLAEIKAIVDADAIDTVIVNDRLTPVSYTHLFSGDVLTLLNFNPLLWDSKFIS